MMNPATFYPKYAEALRPMGDAPTLNEQAARQLGNAGRHTRLWTIEWNLLIWLAGIAFTLARRRVHSHKHL